MAYDAKVLEVMFVSPNDVTAEHQVVREVLNGWNVIHSRARKAMLMPVGWETHSAAELAGRAQQMINDRLLSHCDLLVGIFWTRLGSPTGASASGTVEEIEEHLLAGKPAMLYFSTVPAVPQSIDPEQFSKLLEFKSWAMTKGLISEFESPDDFRELFRRDLELNLRDNQYLSDQLKAAGGDARMPSRQRVTISAEAAELLKTAAGARDGLIMVLRHTAGPSFRREANDSCPTIPRLATSPVGWPRWRRWRVWASSSLPVTGERCSA